MATNIIARRKALAVTDDLTAEVEAVHPAEEEEEEAGADVMCECDFEDKKSSSAEVFDFAIADYINEGVYGAFNCIIYDHQRPNPYPLTIGRSSAAAIPLRGPAPPNVELSEDLTVTMGYDPAHMEKASIWGPTCDGIDCVRQLVDLPKGLEVGDTLLWGEMGAYTLCAGE